MEYTLYKYACSKDYKSLLYIIVRSKGGREGGKTRAVIRGAFCVGLGGGRKGGRR